jgi:hypothetical protein
MIALAYMWARAAEATTVPPAAKPGRPYTQEVGCPLWVTSSGFDNVRLGQVSLTQQTYRRIFLRGRSVP